MYISKVQIKNFRNLQDVTVELSHKVVLLGENGAGKTNFLDALRILLDPTYRALLCEHDFSQGVTKFTGTKIEIHAWFSGVSEENQDVLTRVHDSIASIDATGENIYQLSAIYRPKKDVKEEHAQNEDDYELIRYAGGRENNTAGAREFREYIRLLVIPAVRDMERDMQSWRTSPLRRLVELMALKTNPEFVSIANKVKVASDELQKIPPVQDLQEDIRNILGNVAEECQSIDPTIGIVASDPEDLQKLLTVLVEMGRPLERTSLGLSNLLYLVTWLVYVERLRKASSQSGVKPEYVIVAIEEPESHLHPHLQRLVFENMFNREHLILVSTHSSTVVSIAPPESFAVLKRTHSGIIVRSTAQFAPRDEKTRKDIARFLDATRGDIVFSRGVLLIEGDAEMFLLPAFARKMKGAGKIHHTLDGAGISICNVYGTDFRPYLEFLGRDGLDIPFAVLTDGDPTVKNVTEEQEDEFAGLKRGMELAEKLQTPNLQAIKDIYGQGNWDTVRNELESIGIFVNQNTLEQELIDAGYAEELLDVYAELDATAKKQENFQRELEQKELKKIINRMESTGFGKGRFAQRLADKVDENRIPPYIEKAINYVLDKVSKFPC